MKELKTIMNTPTPHSTTAISQCMLQTVANPSTTDRTVLTISPDSLPHSS